MYRCKLISVIFLDCVHVGLGRADRPTGLYVFLISNSSEPVTSLVFMSIVTCVTRIKLQSLLVADVLLNAPF